MARLLLDLTKRFSVIGRIYNGFIVWQAVIRFVENVFGSAHHHDIY